MSVAEFEVPPLQVLTSLPWWRDLAGRAWRQLYQTAVPIIPTADLTTATGVEQLAVALAGAQAVTLVKFVALRLAGIRVSPGAPLWRRMTERALGAAAGVIAGVQATQLMELQMDARHLAAQAGVAAAIAVIDLVVNPPAPGRVVAEPAPAPSGTA